MAQYLSRFIPNYSSIVEPLRLLTKKKTVEDEDNINVVEYASRKRSETESRYSQSEREDLAVVWATEHFNHYLIGSEFTVLTDHQPLLGIMNKPMSKPTARLNHLCLRLELYKMTLKYAPGKNNPVFLVTHLKILYESWLDLQTDNICIHALNLYESGEDASINNVRPIE